MSPDTSETGMTQHHPEWPTFKRNMLLAPIEAARDKLESPALSPEETAHLRGMIAAYRTILSRIEHRASDEERRIY